MREILFKAKRLDNGEWVEGYYVERDNKSWIYPAGNQVISKSLARELRPFHSAKSTQRIMKEVFPVDPSTVCQYTGLTDKNGKKIFEGDVVRLVYDGEEYIFVVIWDQDELDFKATNGKQNYGPGGFQYLPCCDEIEIVGSIHDGEGGQHEQ